MGIFDNVPLPPVQTEEGPLEIWVDMHLFNRKDMISWLTAEGATISTDMDAPSTRHLIPAHSSLGIFDRFCHPDWIPHKLTRVRAARRETWDIWEGKVLLKAGWVELCRREGRFLGAADGWGGMRAGGPRIQKRSSIAPLKPDIFLPPLALEDLILPIFSPISPPNRVTRLASPPLDPSRDDGVGVTPSGTVPEEDEDAMDLDEDQGEVARNGRADAGQVMLVGGDADVEMDADARTNPEVDMEIDDIDNAPSTGSTPHTSAAAPAKAVDPVNAPDPTTLAPSRRSLSPVKSPTSRTSLLASSTAGTNRRSASPPRTPWTPYETPEPIEYPTGAPVSLSLAEDKRAEVETSPTPRQGSSAGEIIDLRAMRGRKSSQVDAVDAGTTVYGGETCDNEATQGEASGSLKRDVVSGPASSSGCGAAAAINADDTLASGQTESIGAALQATPPVGIPSCAATGEWSDTQQVDVDLKSIPLPSNLPPRPAASLTVSEVDDHPPSGERPLTVGKGDRTGKGKAKEAAGSNALPAMTATARTDSALPPASASTSTARPPKPPIAPQASRAGPTTESKAKIQEAQAAFALASDLAKATSTVFRGCVIKVQKGKYGRKTYMQMIRNGSGTVSDTFQAAATPGGPPKTTHILCDETEPGIIPFPNIQWDMFVRAGAAIVNYEWLVESVKAGQLVPVDQYPPKRRQDMGQASQQAESRTGHDTHVAGDRKAGPAPLNNGNVNKDKDDENDEDDDDDDGSSADPTGAKRKRNPMPLDLLVRIFAAVPPGGRPNYDELVEKYPYYPRTTWTALWSKFKQRTHRFSNVPPDPADFRLEVHGRMPQVKHRRALAEGGTRSTSTLDRQSQVGSEENSSSLGRTGQVGKGREAAMSTERLVEIFSALPKDVRTDCAKLAAEHGHYPAGTWSILKSDYNQRKRRFANVSRSTNSLAHPNRTTVEKNGEGSGSGRRDRTTPELEQIFRQGKAMSHLSNSERMHVFSEKLPEYGPKTIHVLYTDYRKRAGRFNGRAPTPVDTPTPVPNAGLTEAAPDTIPADVSLAYALAEYEAEEASLAPLREIFGNRHLEGVDLADKIAIFSSQLPEYSEASVRSLYTDFQQQRGRFQPQPSYEQPVDAPAVATVAPVAADVAGTTAAANSRRGPHGLISIPCQLQIFSSRYAEDVRLNRTLGAIGKDLHAQHGHYSAGSWRNYYSEWRRGFGQFAEFGPLADHVPAHLAHKYPTDPALSEPITDETAGEDSRVEGDTAVSSRATEADEQIAAALQVQAAEPSTAPLSTQSASNSSRLPGKASLQRARLFRDMEDAIRRNPREAANKLWQDDSKHAEYGVYDATTWFRMMTSWTNGTAQFSNLPEHLRYGYREVVGPPTSAFGSGPSASAATTPLANRSSMTLPPSKRVRDSASLRPSPSPAPSNRSQRSELVVEIPTRSPRPSPSDRFSRTPTRDASLPTALVLPKSSIAASTSQANTIPPVLPIPPEFATQAKLRAGTPSMNSALAPLNARGSGNGTSGASRSSQSPTKRTAQSDISSRPSKKQVRNTYTESEEAEMAVYVSSRLPRATESRLVDWQPFTDTHTARTPAAWVEHYRQYRARIEALVRKLGGRIPGKRRPGQKRSHDEDDSEVEYLEDAPATPVVRAGQSQKQEIIIIDSDDE